MKNSEFVYVMALERKKVFALQSYSWIQIGQIASIICLTCPLLQAKLDG